MSPLNALCYRSVATGRPVQADLEALLFDARAFNAHSGVTGVLVLAGARFFQYIEGPRYALVKVYERIAASQHHHSLEVLFAQEVPHRLFDTWHMGLLELPDSLFLKISERDWEAELQAHAARLTSAPGLQALLEAWRAAGPPK